VSMSKQRAKKGRKKGPDTFYSTRPFSTFYGRTYARYKTLLGCGSGPGNPVHQLAKAQA